MPRFSTWSPSFRSSYQNPVCPAHLKLIDLITQISDVVYKLCSSPFCNGDRGSTVVKGLRYKSERRWFDPRWCPGILYWHKSFWSHYGPQPLTEMSTRRIYWG
jgi:hypothetical protein